MVDARHPGTVIGLVVLGSEWLQAEARTYKAPRNDKVIRDEGLSHTTRLRRAAIPHRERAALTPIRANYSLGEAPGVKDQP
jgi:hypothetical protein